jgi:hypothetical protein
LCTDAIDESALAGAVDALQTEGYLVVKYADSHEYCLGATPQGRSLVAEVRAERARREKAAEEARQAEVSRQRAEAAMRQQSLEAKQGADGSLPDQEGAADQADVLAPNALTEESAVPASQQTPSPSVITREGKMVLFMWLAAFFGALLGGGIVGLVMYLLHITLG